MACSPRWASPVNKQADTEGTRIVEFIEALCLNPQASHGAEQFSPVEVRDWQRELIEDLFELLPDGKRKHRRAVIGLPSKNGKSFLIGAIALYALVMSDPNSQIVIAASAKEQTKNVFLPLKQMVEASPELSAVLTVQRNNIENKNNGSNLIVISADAGTADGTNADLVIMDEIHRLPNSDLWDVLDKAISARPKAMLIAITTAGHDKESLCYRLYERGKKLHTGELAEPSFFFRWFEPKDADAAWDDPAVWAECNPAFGDFVIESELRAIATTKTESSFRRLHLNQWTSTYNAWLRFGAWDACRGGKPFEDGEAITLGFDGSISNDSTALVGCSLDGLHLQVINVWEKDPNDDDWRVDTAEVRNTIVATCERYDVREIAVDISKWRETFEYLSDQGFPVVKASNYPSATGPRTRLFADHVYEKRVTHDGHPVLSRHVDNCVVKVDASSGNEYVSKDYKMSSRKIDAAIAAMNALEAAVYHRESTAMPSVLLVNEDGDIEEVDVTDDEVSEWFA